MSTHARELDSWYKTPLGQYLWAREQALLEGMLAGCFGHHGLEVGSPAFAASCLQSASIAHKIRLYNSDDIPCFNGAFIGRLDELSLQPQSLAVAVLVHVLEFQPAPGRILAAVEQALVPGGVLCLSVFNPASLWGARRWLGSGESPWQGRYFSAYRCRDWLEGLHLKVTRVAYAGQRPPVDQPRWLDRFRALDRLGPWCPTAAVYVIAARKRELRGERHREEARQRRHLLAPGAPQASRRTARDNAA